MRLAEIIPWTHIEEIYVRNLSEETGRPAISSRIAFGALYINDHCHLTDEGTVTELQENPYMHYSVWLHEFHPEPLFDSSMMVHFRKRFPVEEAAKINKYVCTGKWPWEQRNVDRNDEDGNGTEPSTPPFGDGEGTSKLSKQEGKANKNTSKKKEKRRKKNRWKLILDAAVARATRQLGKYSSLVSDVNTLFPRWLRNRLAVIPVVYQQQKEMYDNRTHSCKNRIVSLEQPHVRPIQRGKRPNPTEFGQKLHLSVVDSFTYLEQTSLSNFNAGCDLEAAVEDYLRKFGCYPASVLADKIYQTHANKLYCKECGTRLSGLLLGRRQTSAMDAKIMRRMYHDSCERNAIEGRNGIAKRRFGLDCIFSKLDETAKTEAALILLSINASLRLARWLALFFRNLLFPLQLLCFSVDPN